MTEATARQQRLAELVDGGRVTGDSRVRLFPVLMGGGNGQFTVLRRDTGRMISTSQEGADAIRLMLKGSTLQATRQGLANKYGCDPDGVDFGARVWGVGPIRGLPLTPETPLMLPIVL